MSNPNRHPSGTPTGGQFATGARGEPDVDLSDPAEETPTAGAQVLDLADNGPYAPLRVRVVMPGQQYGATGSLTNHGEPLVEFYDKRYQGSWFDGREGTGQFISRYNLSTLQTRQRGAGLDLDGGTDSWKATEANVDAVVSWAEQQVARDNSDSGDDDWDEDEDVCSECGASLDDGEGWDGLCGSCADRAEVEGRWS